MVFIEIVSAFLIPPFLRVFSNVLGFGVFCPCIFIDQKELVDSVLKGVFVCNS